ncbi:MAG TPA: hypothetical protein VFK40_14795 [Nitrososphaeraceae archaeon]|nr:hypothetical protein [Nitrososphaeraceae archaeon]
MLTTIKNNKQITILSLIFIGLIIPNVIVYLEHSLLELGESKESAEKGFINKSTRQLGEGTFFALVATGYIITSILVFTKPNNVVPYYVILVGTVAIIIVYYFRTMTGIPVIGTDLIIKEYTVDYRDVITKIAQQAFVIPLAMMLQRVYDMKKLKNETSIIRRL